AKLEQRTVTSLLKKWNNPRSIYVAPFANLRLNGICGAAGTYSFFGVNDTQNRGEAVEQVFLLASIGTGVGQCSPANQVIKGLEALLLALLWEDLRPDIVCLTLNELELVHNDL
ncbi:hypothetical protein Tco_0531298, partial [Tanacetum coccineum]